MNYDDYFVSALWEGKSQIKRPTIIVKRNKRTRGINFFKKK